MAFANSLGETTSVCTEGNIVLFKGVFHEPIDRRIGARRA